MMKQLRDREICLKALCSAVFKRKGYEICLLAEGQGIVGTHLTVVIDMAERREANLHC